MGASPKHTLSPTKVLQLRTGRIKNNLFSIEGFESAILKTSLPSQPVYLGVLGLHGDSHACEGSGGPDKALLHYAASHYDAWRDEFPKSETLNYGGFGENLLTGPDDEYTEHSICIGDIFSIGANDVRVQVTQPRQPCFKLNHRLEVEDIATRAQRSNRTGWHNRVLHPGYIEPGDTMRLLERKYPKWPITRIQHYLFSETHNIEVMRELTGMEELGSESKSIFRARVEKHDQRQILRIRELDLATSGWFKYRLTEKKRETAMISSFTFEAIEKGSLPEEIPAGAHVRVKLGHSGNLVRAYSVVGGNSRTFTLGISKEKASRGGSKFIHDHLKLGDKLSFSKIASDFPIVEEALCDAHIFIAGGVGVTAFVASAKILKAKGIPFTMYYAIKREADAAFSDALAEFSENVKYCISENGTKLDMSAVLGKCNNRTHVYICGPTRLLNSAHSIANRLGFPISNIHSEAFVTSTSGDPFKVRIESKCKEYEVKEQETLLDVLRVAGLDIPSVCEVGNCGTCRVRVTDGRVEHRGTGLLDGEKKSAMLSCVSRGVGTICLDL